MGTKKQKLLHKFQVLTTMIPLSLIPCHAQAQLVISGTTSIHFGSMVENGAGGTMAVSPAGARTAGGGVTAISGAGFEQAGMISISGTTGVALDLSVVGAPFSVTGPGVAMNVGAFDLISTGSGSGPLTVTLTTSPTTYPVGATLTVNASQASGTYAGTYTVRVNLQ